MIKSCYQNYIQKIHQYDLLTADQEVALAKRVQCGDANARMKLVTCNLRLVASVAARFTNKSVSIMDLIQEGNMGLMVAASRYKAGFNTRFSTYAYPWIMQYIIRFLNTRAAAISLPQRKDEILRKISQARVDLQQKFGREPTDNEIAVYLDMPLKVIKDSYSYTFAISSLDVSCSDETETTVGDLITDERYAPETQIMNLIQKEEINSLLSVLSVREQEVINKRFNLNHDDHPQTLREISATMGVSAETIRQMEVKALRRMQEYVKKNNAVVRR